MRLLLGLFFLLACTGAPSDGYHRGTLVRPQPAPHRPGVGAPVVGQPGQHPDYPRGPHKRVLPPERGPGLWAADVPRASDDEAPGVALFDIPLPIPDGAKTATDIQGIAACAMAGEIGARSLPGLLDRLQHQSYETRRCVVAGVLMRCTNDLVERQKLFIEKNKGTSYDAASAIAVRDRMARAFAASRPFYRFACGPGSLTEDVLDLMDMLTGSMPDPFITLLQGTPQ